MIFVESFTWIPIFDPTVTNFVDVIHSCLNLIFNLLRSQ